MVISAVFPQSCGKIRHFSRIKLNEASQTLIAGDLWQSNYEQNVRSDGPAPPLVVRAVFVSHTLAELSQLRTILSEI